MAKGKAALIKAQGEYAKVAGSLQAVSGDGSAATNDANLDEKRHDRGYNPVDNAERASVSSKLNGDAGRYKQGPGPL